MSMTATAITATIMAMIDVGNFPLSESLCIIFHTQTTNMSYKGYNNCLKQLVKQF